MGPVSTPLPSLLIDLIAQMHHCMEDQPTDSDEEVHPKTPEPLTTIQNIRKGDS